MTSEQRSGSRSDLFLGQTEYPASGAFPAGDTQPNGKVIVYDDRYLRSE
jgi:hypothetical protein